MKEISLARDGEQCKPEGDLCLKTEEGDRRRYREVFRKKP